MAKNNKARWQRYLKYLTLWVLDHQGSEYEQMSPACYDEFCDNDDQDENYDDINYDVIEKDLSKLVEKWKGK